MKRSLLLITTIIFAGHIGLVAQHEHHKPAQKDSTQKKEDAHKDHSIKDDHEMKEMQMPMNHAYSLNLPMNRNGSGTSWLPDESPMYMYMTGKKAAWMIHGNIFLRYKHTDIFKSGSRGGSVIDAPNWLMGMVNKPLGKKGLFTAKAMLSLDPLTEGGDGYPLLFQSGETYNGQKLVDRQHPHDLFSELSIGYSYSFTKNMDAFIYLGYPGEPALGAPAFMHRISSMNNPDAPLSHHWQDATHITFGVATLGFRYKNFKLDGSIFTGREPDENRYDFDEPRFDSYSYRLSYNPTANWAVQFSQGFINEPELLEPEVDVIRTTASVLYSKKIKRDQQYDAALTWGFNDKGDGHSEHSILFEDNHRFGKNVLYSRYEWVQKFTEELDLENEFGEARFDIHAISLGYNRSLWNNRTIELTAGVQATLNFPAGELKPLYGDFPVGGQIYIQLRPALHRH